MPFYRAFVSFKLLAAASVVRRATAITTASVVAENSVFQLLVVIADVFHLFFGCEFRFFYNHWLTVVTYKAACFVVVSVAEFTFEKVAACDIFRVVWNVYPFVGTFCCAAFFPACTHKFPIFDVDVRVCFFGKFGKVCDFNAVFAYFYLFDKCVVTVVLVVNPQVNRLIFAGIVRPAASATAIAVMLRRCVVST